MNTEDFNKPLDEILLKYLSGEATPGERDNFLAWINAGETNKKYFEEIQKQYLLNRIIEKPSGFQRTEGWNRVKAAYYKDQLYQERESRQKTRSMISWAMVGVAASLMLAFLLGKWIYSPEPDTKSLAAEFNEIYVPHGARSQITLSDGTKVWLNAGSTFRYPSRFSGNQREVTLEGEAYFDVTHVENRIFVVKTSDLNIKVYGTRFNVKSYPGEKKITTTLVKGSIAIENKRSTSSPLMVMPNQIVTYYENTEVLHIEEAELKHQFAEIKALPEKQILVIPEANPVTQTSWKDSKWLIEAKELGDLAILLERRYNVKITFDNEELKKYRFSGTLADETFEQVLKVMQISAPITYSINNNLVILYEDSAYRKKYDKMIGN
jgi:ferric-dicitrate binding protein FerR (iron transport regulator)